jgi:MYXO-CTERM domain-containing protein
LGTLTNNQLTGHTIDVQSWNDGSPTRLATPNASGDFDFSTVPGAQQDPFAEVSAYYHLSKTVERAQSAFGFTWTCSAVMPVFANTQMQPGVALYNAFFAPESDGCGALYIGETDTFDLASDGTILAHEYGHAITQATAALEAYRPDPNLGLLTDPSAINEGTSDYYGASFYDHATIGETLSDIPTIGGILEGSALALTARPLDRTPSCPDALYGESHTDGMVWSNFAWALRARFGAAVVDPLVFHTVSALTAHSSWSDLLTALRGVFADLQMSAEDAAFVEDLIAARNLSACGGIVDLRAGTPRLLVVAAIGTFFGYPTSMSQLQARIDVPADATLMRLELVSLDADPYNVHFRTGTPVHVDASGVVSDLSMEGPVIVRRPTDAVSLVPGSELYLSVESPNPSWQNAGVVQLTVDFAGDPARDDAGVDAGSRRVDAGSRRVDAGSSTSSDASVSSASDGSVGAPAPPSSGCGCRVTESKRGVAPQALGLAALVVALVRRRRRG